MRLTLAPRNEYLEIPQTHPARPTPTVVIFLHGFMSDVMV